MSPRERRELLLHEDVVAAQDAGVDHRVAVHLEAEDLAAALDERAVDAHRVDDVLLGEQRQPGGDAPEHRDLDQVDVVGARPRSSAAFAELPA